MPRFTHNLLTDLGLRMVALGVAVGVAFPPFVHWIGFPAEQTFTPLFWAASMAAGVAAGLASFLLARRVIHPRLALLAERMNAVEKAINRATFTGDWSDCTPERCQLPVDSADPLGEAAHAFNDLVGTLFRSHATATAASDFSSALSAELDLTALCEQALERFMAHTGAGAGAVLVEQHGALEVQAHRGLYAAERLASSPHLRSAVEKGCCEKIALPEDVRIEALMVNFRPREMVIVPARFDGRTLGVVVLASSHRFAADTEWLLQLFSHGFGLALNNALAHDELQQAVALDPLTGIYNRRFGMVRLAEEFERARRGEQPLGVLMVDLDHFKAINDQYGHLVGDRVLTTVAARLKAQTRETDVLVRYGGEEFLLVLPGADVEDCERYAERLRQRVARTPVRHEGVQLTVTASVGVTAYPALPVEAAEELVDEADRALYDAKSTGRNRVVIAC